MPKADPMADMAIDSESESEDEMPKGKDELELTLDDMTEKAAKRKIAKLKGPKVRSLPTTYSCVSLKRVRC